MSAACASALLLAGCTGGGDEPKPEASTAPITLRVGTADNQDRPSGRAILEFAREVQTSSGGKLTIQPVWEASGPDVRDWDQVVERMVVGGQLDLGMVPTRSFDTEGVTSFQALQAPFLVTSDALLDRVLTSDMASDMMTGLDGHGIKGLTVIPEGLRHPFGFHKPLLTPGDFAGTTIRTPRSESGYALFRALGARPDDLTGDAVTKALDDGSLGGYDNGYVLAANLPAPATATGNLTLYPKANALVINQKAFDKLPQDQREILTVAAIRTRDMMISSRRDDAAEAQIFCSGGGKVVLASAADLRRFDDVAKTLWADLERDAPTRKLIEEIKAVKTGAPPATAPCGT
jgi:TRAP-type C4-dicarboxylate transport system substrate-binding protein